MRIGVFAVGQNPLTDKPTEYISKSHAKNQVRRLLAVSVSKHAIQLIPIRDANVSCAPMYPARQVRLPKQYEHHLEPRIEELTLANSPWLRYLQGWQTVTA